MKSTRSYLLPTLLLSLAFLLSACGSGPRRAPRTDGYNPMSGYPEVPRETGDEPVRPSYPALDVDALFAKAKAELAKKDYDLAKITLKQITLREPYNLEAHEQYQDILLDQKRFASAYHEFFDILAEDETRGEWLWLFARVVLSKRPTTKILDQELDVQTKSASEAGMTKANALLNEGRREEALVALNGVVKIVPAHIAAHRMLQDISLTLAQESGDETQVDAEISKLMTRYQKLMEEHEVNGDFVYLYERVASLKDPVKESTRLTTLRYMRAVAQDLPGYWLYYGFARACMERAADSQEESEKLALLELSERLYQVCTASDALVGEGWFGLGLAQQALDDLDAAKASFDFALDLAGNHPDSELLVTYGEVLERLNENAAAFKLYQKGADTFPHDERFIYLQGRIHFVEGKESEALLAFEKAYAMIANKDDDFAKQLASTIEKLKSKK